MSEKSGKYVHKSTSCPFSVENSQAVIGILLVVIKCLTLLWHPNKLVFLKKNSYPPAMAHV